MFMNGTTMGKMHPYQHKKNVTTTKTAVAKKEDEIVQKPNVRVLAPARN